MKSVCDQHSETIDGLVKRRKVLHMGMIANLTGEVERELQQTELLVETINSSDANLPATVADLKGTEADLKSFCEQAHAKCAEVYEKHDGMTALVFNEDGEFSRLVQEGVAMKQDALKLKNHTRDTPGTQKYA